MDIISYISFLIACLVGTIFSLLAYVREDLLASLKSFRATIKGHQEHMRNVRRYSLLVSSATSKRRRDFPLLEKVYRKNQDMMSEINRENDLYEKIINRLVEKTTRVCFQSALLITVVIFLTLTWITALKFEWLQFQGTLGIIIVLVFNAAFISILVKLIFWLRRESIIGKMDSAKQSTTGSIQVFHPNDNSLGIGPQEFAKKHLLRFSYFSLPIAISVLIFFIFFKYRFNWWRYHFALQILSYFLLSFLLLSINFRWIVSGIRFRNMKKFSKVQRNCPLYSRGKMVYFPEPIKLEDFFEKLRHWWFKCSYFVHHRFPLFVHLLQVHLSTPLNRKLKEWKHRWKHRRRSHST